MASPTMAPTALPHSELLPAESARVDFLGAMADLSEVRDSGSATSATRHQSDEGRNGEQHDEKDEEDLADISSTVGKTTETEQCGKQGNDEEDRGPIEHGRLLINAPSGAVERSATGLSGSANDGVESYIHAKGDAGAVSA